MTRPRARFERSGKPIVAAAVLAASAWGGGLFAGAVQAAAPAEEPAGGPQILFVQDVDWSPDGSLFAFSGYAGSAEEYEPEGWGIFVAPADGGEPRLLVENAQWVSWSPDGERLAFSSRRGGNWDLYTVGRDGSGVERLTSNEADDRAPCWSPSGKEIAFTSRRDGNSEVYVLAVDGSGERRLTHDPAADHNPAWSPDGGGVVFYRAVDEGAADQIYWIAADGEGERRLTDDAHLNIFPAFLPDGRVGFSRRFHGSEEKRLVVLDPTTSEEALVGPEGAFYARWSPDGSEVLFIAGAWPEASVYRMNADGSDVRKILD